MVGNFNCRGGRSPSCGKEIFSLIPRIFIIQSGPKYFPLGRKAEAQGLGDGAQGVFENPLKKNEKIDRRKGFD
jgi:hypothetical protein